jgi:AraC-like DNA-binding protein
MQFKRIRPSRELADLVRYYWYFEINENEIPFTQLCFPYGSFELLYYLKNPNGVQWLNDAVIFQEPRLCFAGQVTRPYILHYDKPCICCGISFQPWAGKRIFNIPANHFHNQVIPLSDILNCNKLEDQLMLAVNVQEVFKCFEDFAILVHPNTKPDEMISTLGRTISTFPAREKKNAALKNCNLSKRRIEQRFLESVGVNIGTFMKKSRFQLSTRLLIGNEKQENLIQLSHELEYYDQSHFNHEFRNFSGMSPREFLRSKNKLVNFFQTLTEPLAS